MFGVETVPFFELAWYFRDSYVSLEVLSTDKRRTPAQRRS